jgi:hypothetical protein
MKLRNPAERHFDIYKSMIRSLLVGACAFSQSAAMASTTVDESGNIAKTERELSSPRLSHRNKRNIQPTTDTAQALPLSSNRARLGDNTRTESIPGHGTMRSPMKARRAVMLADNTEISSKVSGENLGPRQTEELTLKDDLTPQQENKFHLRLRSYNAMDLDAAEGASGKHSDGSPVDRELRAWERLDLRYDITKVVSFAVMPEFSHTWFGAPDRAQDSTKSGLDQSYSFYMGNTALILNDDKIAELGDITLNGYFRYDLPTSEQSQKDNSPGETRVKLGLARKFGKLGMELGSTLRNYFQQYTSSNLVDSKGVPVQNMNYRIDTVLDTSYDVTTWFSLFFEVGLRSQMTYADGATGRPAVGSNSLILNPELDFNASKNLSFALGIFELPSYTNVDQQKYAPLAADPQNGNEAYLQATLQF